jgi:hypothetical protein
MKINKISHRVLRDYQGEMGADLREWGQDAQAASFNNCIAFVSLLYHALPH